MPDITLLQAAWQVLFSFLLCLLFYFSGALYLKVCRLTDFHKKEYAYGFPFYALLTGFVLIVSLYAVVVSGFKTIHILALPALLLLINFRRRSSVSKTQPDKTLARQAAEMLFLSVFFVAVFNFLPESEYKQADSFFYLKISEALNLTGQENVHHYYNLYDKAYHGAEPYHYIELWSSAMAMRFTGSLLPHIQVFRIVGYSIISVIFIFGLFHLFEVVTRKPVSWAARICCLCFLFFFPDLLEYSASMKHLAIFTFENSFLERPNFRTIYLFFIPLFLCFLERKSWKMLLFSVVCFCLASYAAFLTVMPVVFLLWACSRMFPKSALSHVVQRDHLVLITAGVALAYITFYALNKGGGIPGLYKVGADEIAALGWEEYRFMLIALVTSLSYVGFLLLLYLGLFLWRERKNLAVLIDRYSAVSLLSAAFILSGITMARLFYFKDNAYQFAFISYITASLLILAWYMHFSASFKRQWFLIAASVIFISGYGLFKFTDQDTFKVNIFSQNGRSCYDGKPYSAAYIRQVTGYCKARPALTGGYVADSIFYRNLYYSRRNPNVYFMPISYIIAGQVKSNFEFCLSDERSIMYNLGGHAIEMNYLRNAIYRSFYNRYAKSRKEAGNAATAKDFVKGYRLDYMILSPHIDAAFVFGGMHFTKYTDEITGEQFVMFR